MQQDLRWKIVADLDFIEVENETWLMDYMDEPMDCQRVAADGEEDHSKRPWLLLFGGMPAINSCQLKDKDHGDEKRWRWAGGCC